MPYKKTTVIYLLWFSPVIAFVFQKRKRKCTERTGAIPGQEVGFSPVFVDLDYVSPNPEGSLLNPDPNPGFAPKKNLKLKFFFFRQKRNKANFFI